MRVLLAPSNVAAQSTSLKRAAELGGHYAEIWNYGESPNGFEIDRRFDPVRAGDFFEVLAESLTSEFDVYHFHTARSLMPARDGLPQMWDLPLLRALGKRIVVSFHGSDIRRASHHRNADRWSFYNFADIPCDEEKISSRLAIIRTYAHRMTVTSVLDQIYAPDAVYLPKSVCVEAYPFTELPDRKPVVLHATRRRATKGTHFIEEAMRPLDEAGACEFRVVEGASHRELLKQMRDADIVIEKVLGGDAGVLSLEAMALGRVAVARIHPDVRRRHPRMPVVDANPETLADVIGELLTSPSLRQGIGAAGREYVECEHSPQRIAPLLEELYAAKAPASTKTHPDWASDPSPRRLEAAHDRIRRLEEQISALKYRLSGK